MHFNIYKHLFLWGIALTLVACQAEIENIPLPDKPSTQKEKKERLFMRTKTKYLRIRATPDIEAPVLEVLRDEALLEYLQDSTSFTTEVNFRGKEYHAHWYKIKSSNTAEGWIYGALVDFIPYLENKQLVIKTEAEETLAAANQDQPQLSKKQQQELEQPVFASSLQSYKNYLNNLSTTNINSVAPAIAKFQALFVGSSNVNTCDAAYVAFHDFHQKVLSSQNKVDWSDYQYLITEIQRYGKVNMQRNEQLMNLERNGFNFGIKDNKVVLVKDLDVVFRVFYRECSSAMRAYFNQYEIDETTYWLDNQKLLITPKELSRWVLSWNYFVAKNPKFVWYNDAQKRLNNQLSILVNGTANTAVFDNNKSLNESFKDAYLHISKNYPDSKIGKAFSKYMLVLEQSQWLENAFVRKEKQALLGSLLE